MNEFHDDVDRELESLLRGNSERLAPPDHLWDSVRHRARRRKAMKAGLAAAAAVVVIGGAVPAVIAVRDNGGGNQNVNIAASPKHTQVTNKQERPVPRPTTLAALDPQTVSFDAPGDGWVSGALNVDGGQIDGGLGQTTDGGQTWTPVLSRPAPVGLVRMARDGIGFSFGTGYQVTRDGGQTWRSLPSPGYIEDIETREGSVWALVKSCVSCAGPRLFTATLADPTLHEVTDVPPVGAFDSAVMVAGNSIYVTGGKSLWRSLDLGKTWRRGVNPCAGQPQSFATWSSIGLAAECTPVRGVGSLLESTDGGLQWDNVANIPAGVRAGPATLSAGTHNNLLVTTGNSTPWVTTTAGHDWHRAAWNIGPVTYAAYIGDNSIVGLRGGPYPAFVSSQDAGGTWAAWPFAG